MKKSTLFWISLILIFSLFLSQERLWSVAKTCIQNICYPLYPALKNVKNIVAGKSQQALKSPQETARQLFILQEKKDPAAFYTLLEQAAQHYSIEDFKIVLYSTNRYDYTLLMVASALADVEQINFIFKILEQKFGANVEAIADYVIYRDGDIGYSALLFGADAGRIETVIALVEPMTRILKDRKDLFLKFLNTADNENENNPITLVSYDSSSIIMQYLIKEAIKFFGRESEEYWHFINYTDNDEATALHWALNPKDRYFIRNHGGVILKETPPDLVRAETRGKELLKAMFTGDEAKMKEIMDYAQTHFTTKDDSEFYYAVINQVDQSGANPILFAASQGNMNYLTFIMKYIAERYKDNYYRIYNELRNTTYDGRTSLMLAIMRRHKEVALYLIDLMFKYAPNKYFVYMWVTKPRYVGGFSPLIAATYDSNEDMSFLEVMQKLVDPHFFSKGSRANFLLINQTNYDCYTALNYATIDEIREFLLSRGALPSTEIPCYTDIFKLGVDLFG